MAAGEEREIVQRAIAGDPDALWTLFARERVRLYQTAFSVLRNKEDAEDALQDGLLSACANLESFEGRSRFSTWLSRIVFNAALMNRRRLRAHPDVSLDEIFVNDGQPWTEVATDDRSDPEKSYAVVEMRGLVEKKMNRLSGKGRSAFRLRHVEDLSTLEAAKAASIKIGALKSRALRARRQLATLLAGRSVNL
jgi:RNA polymerase sigma-70 factor, ECF subfamily